MEAAHDELNLSSVVCVNACPPREFSNTFFYFELHYSDYDGSPWLLRAYTQVQSLLFATMICHTQ